MGITADPVTCATFEGTAVCVPKDRPTRRETRPRLGLATATSRQRQVGSMLARRRLASPGPVAWPSVRPVLQQWAASAAEVQQVAATPPKAVQLASHSLPLAPAPGQPSLAAALVRAPPPRRALPGALRCARPPRRRGGAPCAPQCRAVQRRASTAAPPRHSRARPAAGWRTARAHRPPAAATAAPLWAAAGVKRQLDEVQQCRVHQRAHSRASRLLPASWSQS